MKKIIHIISLILFAELSFAQVGIETTNPQAQLDIRSSNQATPAATDGILIPKVDVFPIGVNANQDAMLVYLTTTIGLNTPGFYYYDHGSTTWIAIGKGAKLINDLFDGKSDNDGTDDGSSIFIGIGTGANDDATDNRNTGIGFETLTNNLDGELNIAVGYMALRSNLNGGTNIALGSQSLFSNTVGGFNIAIGRESLFNNLDGGSNLAIGYRSLFSNTTGVINLALGTNALSSNVSGDRNIAIGSNSLRDNSIGTNNIAVGYLALSSNTIGNNNSAIGYNALITNTDGYNNIALGYEALYANTSGFHNIGIGDIALRNNTTGYYNVAYGNNALRDNLTGNHNTALGNNTLLRNNSGGNNVAIGTNALTSNAIGSSNVSIGINAMSQNNNGSLNVSIGNGSMFEKTTGNNNVAIGNNALYENLDGMNNVSIGYRAGYNNTNGTNNIFIGSESGYNETGSDKLYIENTTTNEPLIYGDFGLDNLQFNGNVVISNINGTHANATLSLNTLEIADLGSSNLGLDGDIVPFAGSILAYDLGNNILNEHWDDVVANAFVTFSDRNTKEQIQTLTYGIDEVMALKPVSYRYKSFISPNNNLRLGLIAQDVEEVIPEVVINDDVDMDKEGNKIITKGDFKALNYIDLIPVLIKAIQEQQITIEKLEKEVEYYKLMEKRILALEAKIKD